MTKSEWIPVKMPQRRITNNGLAFSLFLCVVAFLLAGASQGSELEDAKNDRAAREIGEFIGRYCADCHSEGTAEAGVELDEVGGQLDLLKHRKVWLRALDQVQLGRMPPEDADVDADQRRRFISSLDRLLNDVNWKRFANPGRQRLARLTAVEYRNSVRDIFGMDLDAGVYLQPDPEGQTGFTNDRAGLSFAPNAFEVYLKEAERAVDAVMAYGKTPWQKTIEMEQAWKRSNDKAVGLNAEANGVLIKENVSPFHFTIDPPQAGMHRIQIEVAAVDGEPISGLTVSVDGRLIRGVTVRGRTTATQELIAYLPNRSCTITLGFSPEYAPIIQPKIEPRGVPSELQDLVAAKTYVEFIPPKGFPDTEDALKTLHRMNTVIREFSQMRDLAQLLMDRDLVQYDGHTLKSIRKEGQKGVSQKPTPFRASKVPLNLSAGKVAQLMGIPQRELETQIKRDIGFSYDKYAAAIRQYNNRFGQQYPERVLKKPGKLSIDRVVLASHAGGQRFQTPHWLFDTDPTPAAAKSVLERLGRRAYGRPLDKTDLASLMRIYDSRVEADLSSAANGSSAASDAVQRHREGLRDAMVGLLVSPKFLLRFSAGGETEATPIDDYEFASRMSHFLWLSVPDDQLIRIASEGGLSDSNTVRDEMQRMISDPRFNDFCQVFMQQWLNIESIDASNDLGPLLSEAMIREPGLQLQQIIRDDQDLLQLVDGKTTYVNDLLAIHYGIPDVTGEQMRPVLLTTAERGGLLGMGAILAATSTPDRTSPVSRGAWIVEILLGENLPLPPPSVPELKTTAKARTIREELELHRQSKQCASCHNRIDPFGFVLENYDRLGAWRTDDHGRTIDARTTLDNGKSIDGLAEFKTYLRQQRHHDFIRNLTIRMFEFALGREMTYHDEAMVRDTTLRLKNNQFRAQTLIQCILESDAMRRQSDQTPTESNDD
ncbi:DUF1588 domain-containing protein [Stieleria sp. TO1_6]|uniref:DUF1588 domain-containing protein n=1 Tax=Stieleria tagensis TaxID=2956795 RepID=UPI00209ACE9E|nr:DUF1588 domain-containing protein [Stieleria tagensis]MCO8124566.1 DUF1588 domain-containing protein [Stieleria tagensis]